MWLSSSVINKCPNKWNQEYHGIEVRLPLFHNKCYKNNQSYTGISNQNSVFKLPKTST